MVVLAGLVGFFALPAPAQDSETYALGLGDLNLTAVEEAPEISTESTIVEIPVPITLRAAGDGKFGIRLRLSVFFSWNNVRFVDIEGEDIAASLETLTIVPGIEFMVPVGERWLVRPYAQIGGLKALDLPGYRWMASLGSRASVFWQFDRWILSAGGRLEYTAVFNQDWRKTDGVAFIDLGEPPLDIGNQERYTPDVPDILERVFTHGGIGVAVGICCPG